MFFYAWFYKIMGTPNDGIECFFLALEVINYLHRQPNDFLQLYAN